MRDVAALAGVSIKTVSRVVNREGGVTPDVVARVEKAVAQLGYRHNLAASNLRRVNSRSAMIGALLQDVSNSFSASLLRSLEDAARDRDVVIIASSLDEEADRERELVEGLVRRRVDGLLLMPATDRQDYLSDELRSGLPVVFVDRRPNGVDADSVTIDNALGSQLAVEHLVAHGHRRIAMLGDLPTIQTASARARGFRAAVAKAGIPEEAGLVEMSLRSSEDAIAAVGRLLDSAEPPTALFAARNSLAIGALRAAPPARRLAADRPRRLRRLPPRRHRRPPADCHPPGRHRHRRSRRAAAVRPHRRGRLRARAHRADPRARAPRLGRDPPLSLDPPMG